MCDCFHLSFPNWHSSGAGAGRRLRGPEAYPEDESVCEEPPAFIEGERPRPQGSSPIEEFPNSEKYQTEDNLYDSIKSDRGKKGKRVGFGGKKRSSAKMNHTETGESAVIVQTAKEACAQGLIVGGGGKEGIFIKEVKPESPASKHLSVKEGDQILSATVYFDNVSYEDALQILEHAQPYKMELRLKRKNVLDVSTTEVGTARPEGEEGDSPVLRGRKSKRQDARISWPKFPSFSMGRKAQFKRSHSTSEAEDKRKLEMSPTTSDTESPIKSPGGKEKKKKMKLKGKKKGLRSKSVEQTTEVEEEAATENQDQAETELAQYATDLIAIDDAVRLSEEARQKIKEDEFQDSELNKAIKEQTFPSSTGSDIDTGIHKVELITLDRNLKTTDITEALAISSTSFKTTPEITAKKERSELKVKIQGKDLLEANIETQAKYSPAALKKQGTPSYDSIMFSSKMSQEDTQGLDANIISQITNQDMEMHLPKVDASVDVVDMELLKKSPTSGTNKQWKERTTVFPETEIYGIRTRGPLADIATSKAHFAATANGFQFSETDLTSSLPKPVISQPKTNTLEMTVAGSGPGGTETELASKFPVQTRIDDVLEKIGIGEEPRFKLPKIDLSELPHTEVIKMTEVENIKAQFPKREELEIPGMEDGTSKINVQKQVVKLPQMDVSKDIHSVSEIQAQKTDDEFNLEDVKTAVAKMQSFKVPRIDMSGIHVHTGVTKTEVIDKITAGAPSRPPSQMKEEINVEGKVVIVSGLDSEMQDTTPTVKLPKIELPYIDHEQLSVTEIDYSKPRSKTLPDEFQGQVDKMNYKLPNRDEIEIPGMEAIEKTHIQMQKMTTKSVLPLSETKESNEQAQCRTSQMDELIKKEVISEKKSKKDKMSSFGITKSDIRFPDSGIDLIKQDAFLQDTVVDSLDSLGTKKDLTDGGEKPEVGITLSVTQTAPLHEEADMNTKDSVIKMSPSKIKLPKLKLPKIGVGSETKMSTEKEAISAADVSIVSQTASVEVKTAAPNVEAKVPDLSKFKLPKFEISLPMVKLPDISMQVSGRQVKEVKEPQLDVQAPDDMPDVERIKSPKVAIEYASFDKPDLDDKATDGSKFKLPKFGISMPKVKVPDISMQTAKVKVKASLPEAKSDVYTGDLNTMDIPVKATAEISEVDTKEMKQPKISFPKFGFLKPDIKDPGIDITIPTAELTGLPTVVVSPKDTNITIPTVEASLPEGKVKTPNVEIGSALLEMNVVAPDGEIKLSNFGISESKVKAPDISLQALSPHVDVSQSKADVKPTDISIQEVPLEEAKFGFSKPEDNNTLKTGVPVPELKAENKDLELDVQAPKSVDIRIPETNIVTPEVDTKISDGSKFKLPTFGIPIPKLKGPDKSLPVSRSQVTVSIPEAEASVKPVALDVKEVPVKAAVEVSEVEVKEMKKPMISIPTIGLPKFYMKSPEIDVTLPKSDSDQPELHAEIKEKGLDVQAPKEQDIIVPGTEVSISGGKIKPPYVETEGALLETDIVTPDLDSKFTDGSKFKLPKFGISMPKVKGPDIRLQTSKPQVDISMPEMNADVQTADLVVKEVSEKAQVEMSEVEGKEIKKPKFSFPKFGFSKSDIKAPEIDVTLPKADIAVPQLHPEVKEPDLNVHATKSADITIPAIDVSISGGKIKPPTTDTQGASLEVNAEAPDVDTKGLDGSKFKLPKFGISMPKMKEPDISLQTSKPQVDISLPEMNADVQTADLVVKEVSEKAQVEMPEMEGKEIKKPKFSFPKFGFSKSDIKAPEIDVTLPKADITVPQLHPEVKEPDLNVHATKSADITIPAIDVSISGGKIKPPTTDTQGASLEVNAEAPDVDTKGLDGSKFKLPKFGISMPKMKEPDISLQTSKPQVDISLPEMNADVQPADLDVKEVAEKAQVEMPEMEGKEIKKPKFSFPKFGFSKSDIKAPEIDVTLPKADITVPQLHLEVKEPDLNVHATKSADITIPAIDVSISGGKIKPPTIDTQGASLEVNAEAPDVDTKGLDGSKFKLPKFGISMPKVKGPDISLQTSKPQVDISLQDTKADVQPKDLDVKEVIERVQTEMPEAGGKEIKKAKFSFPKFGFSKPDIKGPEIDVTLPKADITAPEFHSEVKEPELNVQRPKGVDMTIPAIDVSISDRKIKPPTAKIGISMEKVKGPDINLQASGPQVDISLPEAKADGQPADLDVKEVADVNVEMPEMQGKGMKERMFSFPKFGFSRSEMKGPEIDVPLPKTDSALPEIHPEIKEHGLNAQLPKCGDITIPEIDVLISDGKMEPPTTEIQSASLEVMADASDVDTKDLDGSKFKLPKFGISMPKMKGPDISLQTSGPQEDISLPEIKADIQPTDLDAKEIVDKAQVEIPKAEGKEMKRSKFSFPKFSFSKPDIKAPEIDVTLPKADIAAPKFHPVQLPKGADITIPAIDESISDGKIKPPNVKTESTPLKVNAEALDVDAKGLEGSKFKLPKFGISMPKVKGPDISLQASGPEVDISLPEAKADDQPADLDVKEIAGKAQVEMPEVNGTEMKFGLSWSDIKGPEIDVPLPKSDMAEVEGTELNVHATKGADITIPAIDVSISQGKIKPPTDEIQGASLEMNAEAPDVDIKGLDGSRFKLPKFGISMPKVKGPDIRLQASGPQVDTSLPEAKTNVQATDLNVKDFPGKAVVSIPEVEGKEIKKPKFSFPRFGFSKPDIRTPEIDVTLPKAGDVLHPEIRQSDVELDTKVRESNLNVQSPQKLDVTMPVTDASILEAKIKAPKVEESDADTKALDGSKFKLPKFGISVPKVKGPDISMQVSGSPQIDISDVKTDVQPLDTDIEQVSAEAAVELPDVKETKGSIKDKVVAGSLTKFKLPSFSLPKFGGPADMSIKGDGTEILSAEISSNTEGTGVTSDVTDVKDPLSKSTDVDAKAKSAETEQQESKFSLPKFSISLPKVQVSETRQIDSEAEAPKSGFSKGDIKTSEVKMSSTETKSEKDEAAQDVSEAPPELKDTSIFGSPTRFKLPSFKLPKIGISSPKRQAEIEVGAKVTEISMTDTELKVSSVIPSSEGQESSEVPETQKDIDEVVLKGQEDLPDSKDGQIKTKKSSFSFPKFGFTKPEVQVPKVNLPEVDTSLPEGSMEVTEPADGTRGDKEDKDANITGSPTKFKIPTIKFPKFGVTAQKITGEDHNEPTETKELNVKIQDTDSNVSGHKIEVTTHEVGLNSDVSVPEDSVQVKMTEPGVKSPEDKTEVIKTVVSPSKFKLAFKLPTFGVSPAKEPADVPKVDAKDIEADNDQKVLGEVASTDIKVVKEQPMDGDFITTGQLDGQKLKEKEDDALKQASAGAKESEPKVTLGSPSKFKLPTFKLPRFGAKTKTETDVKTDVSEPEVKSSSTVSQAELPNIPESEVMDSGLEKIAEDHKTEVKKPAGVESSPSKFKLPTFKMSKFGVSKSKPEILEVSVTSDNSLETAHKDETKTPEKFSLSTIGGVLRGFDVEFNVPKMEESSKEESTEQVAQEKEVESAMTISEKQNNADVAEKFPKLGVSQTPEDTKTSGVTGGDSLKQTVAQEGQKVEFPEFPQTKSATCVDSESTKQKADLEDHSASENIADDTSLTFSVRSSDAFADVSSAQTTEHVSTLPQSPTRVTVKFSESSNTGGAADIQGELITSTARSELISMEPHLPEKINIPYSSDVSSSSVDTLKQEPGAVHIITSNVQAQPDTEQITVLTHFGEQGVQHFPIQQVTIQTASGPWSLEQTSRVQDGWDIRVEKHMVKEMSGEDKEKVIITQRTHVFEVDTSEPKTGDAASSIQRLRDTVHTEKIRFFESQGIPSKLSAESTETTDKDVPFHSLKEHQDE
ncbi:neuroblast differentiation-associated protein AHNAK isoform X2 [Denticeps clupeoides]|uniref:neuroblast differentiation-associated protein AHNAK isoform X2 n=1 Tax=Denticeps clupeoides TaxID=299321 RepID=UPI0010A4AAAD|nr:neuroblast differentiation-associated protein AHNAK-like isoform X2 [Denticeps clupeoides]